MTTSAKDRVWAFGLWVGFVFYYWYFRPSIQHQVWDSLWHPAIGEEAGLGPIYTMHALSQTLLECCYEVIRAVGYQGRAFHVYAFVNCLAASTSVALLYLTSRLLLKVPIASALGMVLMVGGSAGVLSYTLGGDSYALAMLFSIVAWSSFILAHQGSGCFPILTSSIALGLSISSHLFNGVSAVVGAYLVAHLDKKRKVAAIIYFLLWSGIIVVINVVVVPAFVDKHAYHAKHYAWSQFTDYMITCGRYLRPEFIIDSAFAASRCLLVESWNGVGTFIRDMFLALLLAGVALLCGSLSKSRYALKDLGLLAFAQSAVMGCIVTWWLPWSSKLWLLALLPMVFGVSIALASINSIQLQSRTKRVLDAGVFSCGVITVIYNIWFIGLPQRHDTPQFIQSYKSWLEHTSRVDILITAGDLSGHLKFYYDRPWTIPTDFVYVQDESGCKFRQVRQMFSERVAAGGRVFVAHDFAKHIWSKLASANGTTSADVEAFLGSYKWEKAFTYYNNLDGLETVVYVMVTEVK